MGLVVKVELQGNGVYLAGERVSCTITLTNNGTGTKTIAWMGAQLHCQCSHRRDLKLGGTTSTTVSSPITDTTFVPNRGKTSKGSLQPFITARPLAYTHIRIYHHRRTRADACIDSDSCTVVQSNSPAAREQNGYLVKRHRCQNHVDLKCFCLFPPPPSPHPKHSSQCYIAIQFPLEAHRPLQVVWYNTSTR